MSLVSVERDSGVAIIRLNNPPLNLFTRQLIRELEEIIAAIEADAATRCVVVTGAGLRAFSAGSDIKEFPTLMASGRVIEDKLALENAVFNRLAALPQPTIAAIVGSALGGGAEFALCCDYRIMGKDGRIGFPEIQLGTIPGSGGLARLPRLVGRSTALRLILDGGAIDSWEAHDIGLVDEVVDPAACLDAAVARAGAWASRPARAAQAIKRAIQEAGEEGISAGLAKSLEVSRAIFATSDMREGVAAFLEKRTPSFRHR